MEELMDFVKLNNKTLGITGLLIFSDGNFFQIIEGEEAVVKMTFEKIKKDPRHFNIIKMLDKEIMNPAFLEYHSSFTVISDHHNQNELQSFLKKQETNNPEHFKSISYLTQKFIKLT